MAFPERLRQLRRERGLSQEDLGKVLGLSKANISKFETGKLQPSLQHLIALVQYFKVPAEYLLGLNELQDLKASQETKTAPAQAIPTPLGLLPEEEDDPFRRQLLTVLSGEFTEVERNIISRCLTYALRQIDVIRQERLGYSRGLKN